MQTQPNKVSKEPGKRLRKSGSVNDCSLVEALSGREVFPIAFQGGAPRLNIQSEKRAVDLIFQGQVTKANQELQRLLRDVYHRPQAAQGVAHNRQINELLARAVQCAAKQCILRAELGILALTDELTGLYNRRGFQALAERQLKLGRRSGRGMLLFFIDVDGFKQINDSFGHSEGDRTLRRVTEALKNTFRDSDVLARIGGDEFAVLAIEASDHSEATITARLHKYLHTLEDGEARCKMSLSVGVARFDHRSPASIKELMALADQAMYEDKRTRSHLQRVRAETGFPC